MILPLAQMQEASRALAAPLFAGLAGDCEISFEFFPPKTEKMELPPNWQMTKKNGFLSMVLVRLRLKLAIVSEQC